MSELVIKESINAVAEAARDPNMSVEKLEKLISLQERVLDREAQLSFNRDFVPMKEKLPLVVKAHYNHQTKSNYAKLEDINKVIDPILSQYGFGTSARVISQDDSGVSVEVCLKHKDGHSESNVVFMPLDNKGIAGSVNKTMPHAVASSVTYARRVGLCALLGISTGDDTDGNDEQFVTTEQAIEIDVAIKEAGIDRDKLLQWARAEEPRKILAKNYKKVMQVIEQRKAEKGKQDASA